MDKELFSLGKIYPSDFLKPDEAPRCEPMELKLVMDEDGIVMLEDTPSSEFMWGERYWYNSSTSDTMKAQLKDVVKSVTDVIYLPENCVWCDIGGNDQYMLSQVPKHCHTINIDPSFDHEADNCDMSVRDYFSREVFYTASLNKAKIVSACGMFYDITNPYKFLQDVLDILDDDGLLVLQLSYTPLMLEQLEIGNICHEHKFYYSLFNIKVLLERNGFKLMDVQINNTNAGSFRIHCMKKACNESLYSSPTHRDVCRFRIKSILAYEKYLKLDEVETWVNFKSLCDKNIGRLKAFILDVKDQGKVVYGYGASTKNNTVCQAYGINKSYISAIVERDLKKVGLRTVGSNIDIVSELDMHNNNPDYLFVGPAHFISEFIVREVDFVNKGGKFIIAVPNFKII